MERDRHGIGAMDRARPQGAADEPVEAAEVIRLAVARSVDELSRSVDPRRIIANAIALIGYATAVSRIRVYERALPAAGQTDSANFHEWCSPSLAADIGKRAARDGAAAQLARLLPRPAGSEPRPLLTREASDPLRDALRADGVLSLLVVSVLAGDEYWGDLEIDDCRRERKWSALAIETYRTLAAIVGAALVRAGDVHELADAARIIENSATILFRFRAEKDHPISYVSRNITHYGYHIEDMHAAPLRYRDLIHPDDLVSAMDDVARVGDGRLAEASRDIRLQAAGGRYVWFECRITPVRDSKNNITEIEGIGIDIDRRKAAEFYITRFSRTDQLTGLANRNGFFEALQRTFTAARRGGKPFAILYIDLDRFKDINDVLGHSKGDGLLKLVAERLKDAVRDNDVIARFGGDEFAILQTDLADPSDASALATRVLRDLANPPYEIGSQVGVTASIGISFFAPDTEEPEDMLKQADVALYRAKDSGPNQFHFHSQELDVAIIERVTLTGDLRRAIERNELELYYQPQVEVSSGRIVGVEALVRWHHPTRGMLCPGQFIPVAEHTNSIVPLGRWVIDDVCRQIAAWRAEKLLACRVAVNVSAVQMKAVPEFDGELLECLARWDIAPNALEIELTESVLMETTQQHRDVVARLRALGVSIAIDDFGTGYSSLSYLRAYPVNHIKIAQEFIQNLKPDTGDVAIVQAAIGLGRAMGIRVIAEGVETAFQLGLLTEAGCRYIQGYYYSPPVPAVRMTEMLREVILRPSDSLRGRSDQ